VIPSTGIRGFGRRIALALSTGATLLVFSEWFFWARPLPGMLPPDGLLTYLVYSAAAYVFLWTVSAARVRSLPALFLAGAAYGWLVEGIVVQTIFDDLPLSLSFTGLAWHALLSIVVGWCALHRALRRRARETAGLAAGIGAALGLWALWWWTEAPPPVSIPAFAALAFLSTLVLAASAFVSARVRLRSFQPSRQERVAVLGAIAVYALGVSAPARPVALAILPPLGLLLFIALRRNRHTETRADLLAWLASQPGPHPANLAALLLLPTTATAIYALASMCSWRPATGLVLYAITVPAGFVGFVAAFIRIMRTRPAPIESPAIDLHPAA
jgi:hypothetical protein